MKKNKTRNSKLQSNHKKTYKSRGGFIQPQHDDKSTTTVSTVFFPSALYGNRKILTNMFISKKYPSFMDMVYDQIQRVEEAFAYIKQNKPDVNMHVERMNLTPVYKKEKPEKIM